VFILIFVALVLPVQDLTWFVIHLTWKRLGRAVSVSHVIAVELQLQLPQTFHCHTSTPCCGSS